ncbi:biotin--[acetyl-CoA-carboxylase] ligase [Methylovirgula sp. 4M-Z18]|nr:biotin--[acetyl-CoA-carboxylase] ligase [Methylovirgula sp. 4M-Z18]
MRRAKEGDPGKLWIIARQQSGGRGRHGRPWSSPPGNLYASLLLIDPAPTAQAPQLGFVTGIALVRALRRVAPVEPPIALKWPNDALWQGAKLSGMLLEASSLPGGRLACVIGMGINCASHPDGLPYAAANLSQIMQTWVNAEDVFAALSEEIPAALDLWQRGANFAAVRNEWLKCASGLGGPLRVKLGEREITGTFRTIDETGCLLLDTSAGPAIVEAGDVFLI